MFAAFLSAVSSKYAFVLQHSCVNNHLVAASFIFLGPRTPKYNTCNHAAYCTGHHDLQHQTRGLGLSTTRVVAETLPR